MDRDRSSPERPRLGAVVDAAAAPALMRALIPLGFECFQISFWDSVGTTDLPRLADEAAAALEGTGASITALGAYGNSLDPAGRTYASLEALVGAAGLFRAGILSCFAGRVPGSSVPDSLEPWKAAFGPLADRAAAAGMVIALENCRLGDTWKAGKWNIAINPDAWELLFSALPGAPLGLEWEPCHQILAFADPLAQLEAWVAKVVHVHGKDAVLDRKALALRGAYGAARVGRETLPGSGDSDWGAILGLLLRAGYAGSVDIEMPSDSAYRGGREIEGFTAAFEVLDAARRSAAPAPRPT
jgi:sugar phosphate isomerase/epimerase